MRSYRFVCGVILAVVAIAGLTASRSDRSGPAISDSEASALIGGAELPYCYVNATAGCVGTCGTGKCTASASWITGTAGARGTPSNNTQCSNCGQQCSNVWQEMTAE
jgi:hypothetical protein